MWSADCPAGALLSTDVLDQNYLTIYKNDCAIILHLVFNSDILAEK